MYTPAETASMLQVSASTLRRWSSVFEKFLSTGAHRRHRKYNDDDLHTLTAIRDASARGVLMDDIADQLTNTISIQQYTPPPTSALTLPGLLRRLDDQAAQQQQAIDQLSALQARLEALELQIAEHNSLPWWKRILPK